MFLLDCTYLSSSPDIPSRQLSRPTRSSPVTPVPRPPPPNKLSHRLPLIGKHLYEALRQASLPHQHIVDCIIPLIYLRLSPHLRRLLLDERYNRYLLFGITRPHYRRTLLFNRTRSRTLLSPSADTAAFCLCAAPHFILGPLHECALFRQGFHTCRAIRQH